MDGEGASGCALPNVKLIVVMLAVHLNTVGNLRRKGGYNYFTHLVPSFRAKWATVGQQLGHNWATVGQQLGNNWATVGPLL